MKQRLWLLVSLLLLTSTLVAPSRSTAAPPPPSLNMQLVSSFGTPLRRLVANGTRVYLIQGNQLTIFDHSNPDALLPLGSLTFDLPLRDLAAAGNFVYLTDVTATLQVVDVSDPTSPRRRGSYSDTISYFTRIKVVGNDAFLLGTHIYSIVDGYEVDYYLYSLDVSNPDAPAYRARVSAGGESDLLIQDGIAYAVSFYSIQTFDLSDPQQPTFLTTRDIGASVLDLAVAPNRAYVLTATNIRIIDTSNPADPQEIGQFASTATALWAANQRLYTSVSAGLRLFDIRTDTPPDLGLLPLAPVVDLVIEGLQLIAGFADNQLQLIDASDPVDPQLRGSYQLPQVSGCGVTVSGPLVLVADCTRGLTIIDASDLARPRLRSQLSLPNGARSIYLAGTTALLAAGSAGVVIVDVSASASPRQVGSIAVPSGAFELAVQGSLAVVAAGSGGLLAYDISAIRAPRLLGRYQPTGTQIERVVLAGRRAYALDTGGTTHLDILDISNPASMRRLGQADVSDRRFSVNGTLIYAWRMFFLSPDQGYVTFTELIETRDPAHTQVITALYTYGGVYQPGVPFSGGLAYGYDGNTLHAIDATRTIGPNGRLGYLRFPAAPVALATVNNTLYAATGSGLHIVRLDPPLVRHHRAFLPLVRAGRPA